MPTACRTTMSIASAQGFRFSPRQADVLLSSAPSVTRSRRSCDVSMTRWPGKGGGFRSVHLHRRVLNNYATVMGSTPFFPWMSTFRLAWPEMVLTV